MEYVEIPLSIEEVVENLNSIQRGKLLKAILSYAFEGTEPDFSNDPLLDEAFIISIRQCKKGIEISEIITKTEQRIVETFENYRKEVFSGKQANDK